MKKGDDFFTANNNLESQVLFVQIQKHREGKPIHYDLMVQPHKTLEQILLKICNAEGIQLKDYQVELSFRLANQYEDEKIRLQSANDFSKNLLDFNVKSGSRLLLTKCRR